jgi:hypothetical protein
MVEQYYPSTTELIRQQRTRRAIITTMLVATVTLVFGTIGALMLLTPMQGIYAWLLGAIVFASIALPVLVWHYPRAGLYILFAAALLFGGSPGKYFDTTIWTSLVPFWWNISIIGQNFNSSALNGISISPAEIFMIMAFLTWLIKMVVSREFKVNRGPLMPAVLCYAAFVTFGLLNGIFRGGDLTIALWEVRTQYHLIFMFLLAANLITERKHVTTLLWLIVACTAIQSTFAIVKYYQLGGNVPDDGMMLHDEAFMFNRAVILFLLLSIVRPNRALTIVSTLAFPLVVCAIMFNNRRGGIGALVVGFIPLVPLLIHLFKQHKARVVRFAVVTALISAVYFPIAWNGSGPWALPARALRSQSDPNERDAQSNNYRYAEDFDLKFTRDLQPWTGIGYGRPFSQPEPLPMIFFPLKDYLPHNGILWVWMRIGHFGFLAFLMMLFTVIIRGIQIMKGVKDPLIKCLGILAVIDAAMLYIYSKYDMQLISSRTVLVFAVFIGALSVLDKIKSPDEGETTVPGSAEPPVALAGQATGR